jgi:hypothetical protein
MDRESWKNKLETLGIVSIVASLIFVGFQLRQAEKSLQLQLIQSEQQPFAAVQGRVSENSELAEAIYLSKTDPASLSPAQKTQVQAWLEEWLATIAISQRFYRAGAIDQLERNSRIESNCHVYYAHKVLLNEMSEYLSYGFPMLRRFCDE